MDLIKQNFEAIRDRLIAQVPEIRWIDMDDEQLTAYEAPPISFPCALIDTQQVGYNSSEDFNSSAAVRVTVQFGFKTMESTNHLTPNSKAFEYSEILQKAVNAIHGFEPKNSSGYT